MREASERAQQKEMSDFDKKFQKLKAQVDSAQTAANRSEGKLDQLMSQLAQDHGCQSLKDAEKKLADYERRLMTAETDFEVALAEFEENHAEILGELDVN